MHSRVRIQMERSARPTKQKLKHQSADRLLLTQFGDNHLQSSNT